MPKNSDKSEFTFRGLSDMGDLGKHLFKEVNSRTFGVTCTACGGRVEGTYAELLKGVKCKCGETVRLQKFTATRKPRRKS